MRNQYKRRAVWLKRPFPTPVGQLGEEEEEAWGPPPPLPGSPRGAAMAMVIMSPLSELTDTDGFEMHSASQWAPALPAPPTPPPSPIPGSVRPLCWVLSYPGVTARPSSTAQPGSSFLKRLFACFGEGGVGGSSESLLDPFCYPHTMSFSFSSSHKHSTRVGLRGELWIVTHF